MLNVLTLSILIALVYLAVVATIAIVAALRAGGRRNDDNEDHQALAVSRFTIPVSIIVPVLKPSAAVRRTVASLLELNYPEFEVIVVVEGQSGIVLKLLARDWQLEAREFFYRQTINTADVRRIYRSGRDSRLMVIDKIGHGPSDAINCGVNVSRYRYVMPIAPAATFDRDALLRMMTAAVRDPANVVGASGHLELGESSTTTGTARLAARFQRLASARSMMDSRLGWRYLGAGLGPTGGVNVWRRDAIVKLRGFSAAAADPDLDMMFRLQTNALEGGGRFDRGTNVFGHVGPQQMRDTLKIGVRRQQAALEIVSAWARGRGRRFDLRTLAYFIGSEILTPLTQVWIVAATVFGAAAGRFAWISVLLALALLSFGNAAVSNAALLLRGSAAGGPEQGELQQLLKAGPLDFVLYRAMLAAARVVAIVRFVGGITRREPAVN